jgi:hypothetical protein
MEVGRAIAEAWQWLQNEGLLMPDLDQPNGWFCLTRKGAALRTEADLEAYRQGSLLPNALLHPTLAEKVRPMFMRGGYDVAVFQSFKEVEVAVRAAAKDVEQRHRTETDASSVQSRYGTPHRSGRGQGGTCRRLPLVDGLSA